MSSTTCPPPKQLTLLAAPHPSAILYSIIETYGKKVEPKELEEVLRLEYRSKLLNPRWAQAMASQGSGGAYEISTRMTALLGWGGTVGYTDSFAWDQVGGVGEGRVHTCGN